MPPRSRKYSELSDDDVAASDSQYEEEEVPEKRQPKTQRKKKGKTAERIAERKHINIYVETRCGNGQTSSKVRNALRRCDHPIALPSLIEHCCPLQERYVDARIRR